MAVIRPAENYGNSASNLIASLGVVCGVATIVLMLKFRGFKASLNLGSGRRRQDLENYASTQVNGAYRPNRDEFYGYGSLAEPPKKLTPAMVVLPPSRSPAPAKPSRSVTDLTTLVPPPVLPLKSSPNISRDPRGRTTSARDSVDLRTLDIAQLNIKEKAKKKQKKPAPDPAEERQRKLQEKARREAEKQQEKAQKEAEKQRKLVEKEQKKRAAQEEKQRRERERAERRKKKTRAPSQPPPLPASPPPHVTTSNPTSPPPRATSYPTNTLDSSISRSTAPPPYSEVLEVVPNTRDDTGNTSFVKKEDAGSWDLVSQHRQAMRGVGGGGRKPRQLKMDLGYNVGELKVDNSDA